MTAGAQVNEMFSATRPAEATTYPKRADVRRADARRAGGRRSKVRRSDARSSPARRVGAGTAAHPRRRTAGAAQLLVLALVVGIEGIAVTSLARSAAATPAEAGVIAPEAAIAAVSVLSESDDRHRSAVVSQLDAAMNAAAHAESAGAKVTAAVQQAKAAADRVRAAAERRRRAMRDAQRDPRSVARILVAERGWSSSQFSCLDRLWMRESRWNYRAMNPSSGAYGIPQSLPGSKMASAGSDWRTNPVTQIEWGLEYIAARYGTPCSAWAHSESVGWY